MFQIILSCKRFLTHSVLNMRYVAAAMLAVLGGGEPTAANIKKILSSVGIDADDAKVDMVAKELAGKNIEELLEQGKEKLGTMPAAGAAPAGGAAAAGKTLIVNFLSNSHFFI